MRIAIIADVHGNILALEAVLRDLAGRGADLTVNLGDCVSGPLWPAETAARLEALRWPTVRGNHDRLVAESPRALMGASDAFAFDQLDARQRETLGALPERWVHASGVLAFHGTPSSDVTYLLEDVMEGRLTLSGPKAIAERLSGAQAPLLLCGHSHLPHVVQGPGGSLIVNPGSVGCPGYIDEAPPRHISEAGSPHARYAIATRRREGWAVDLIAVEYDWEGAAKRAGENGRPEWAKALATGFVR